MTSASSFVYLLFFVFSFWMHAELRLRKQKGKERKGWMDFLASFELNWLIFGKWVKFEWMTKERKQPKEERIRRVNTRRERSWNGVLRKWAFSVRPTKSACGCKWMGRVFLRESLGNRQGNEIKPTEKNKQTNKMDATMEERIDVDKGTRYKQKKNINKKNADYGWRREKQAASEKEEQQIMWNNPMSIICCSIHARHSRITDHNEKENRKPTNRTRTERIKQSDFNSICCWILLVVVFLSWNFCHLFLHCLFFSCDMREMRNSVCRLHGNAVLTSKDLNGVRRASETCALQFGALRLDI